MVIFHSKMLVYQRVSRFIICLFILTFCRTNPIPLISIFTVPNMWFHPLFNYGFRGVLNINWEGIIFIVILLLGSPIRPHSYPTRSPFIDDVYIASEPFTSYSHHMYTLDALQKPFETKSNLWLFHMCFL